MVSVADNLCKIRKVKKASTLLQNSNFIHSCHSSSNFNHLGMLWVIREGVSFVSILLKKKSFCEVWDFFISSASSCAARDQISVSTFKYSPAQFFHISQHDCFKKNDHVDST